MHRFRILSALAIAMAATQTWAGDLNITVSDSYARAATPSAKTGAAFITLENQGDADRLISVTSDVAARVELHTHKEEDGIMRMIHQTEGFELPEDGTLVMERGSHHVMFMGLNKSMKDGETIPVTLVFEKAEPMTIEVPVDLKRKPKQGHGNGHAHGNADQSGHGTPSK